MLIYLVGQDRKSDEDEEGAAGSNAQHEAPQSPDPGSPCIPESNPLGLKIDPYWVENVQEQPVCTFSR